MNRKVELSIISLAQVKHHEFFFHLLLEDKQEGRKFHITIGRSEAEAIALGLEGVPVPRPLTHDIFKNLLDAFNLQLMEVVIHKLDEENMIFHAYAYCQDNLNIVPLDVRPSDAIALAVRCNARIYTYDEVIEKAMAKPFEQNKDTDKNLPLHKLSTKELKQKLNEAIEKELYEEAILLRDEITAREKSANR